jgi:cellulose biosynthesis protein BcsQ
MIHMVLQGKGGVGKSFVAALMAQYLQDRGQDPVCIDTDPVNATFAGYAETSTRAASIS